MIRVFSTHNVSRYELRASAATRTIRNMVVHFRARPWLMI